MPARHTWETIQRTRPAKHVRQLPIYEVPLHFTFAPGNVAQHTMAAKDWFGCLCWDRDGTYFWLQFSEGGKALKRRPFVWKGGKGIPAGEVIEELREVRRDAG